MRIGKLELFFGFPSAWKRLIWPYVMRGTTCHCIVFDVVAAHGSWLRGKCRHQAYKRETGKNGGGV